MGLKKLVKTTSILFAFIALLFNVQSMFGQDAHTSIKVNIINFNLSADQKTISYDVYFQDIDAVNRVGMMAYTFRAKVPQSIIGSSAKSCSLSNTDPTLGATSNTITSSDVGVNWTMKFTMGNPISTWATSKIISDIYPGSKIATYSITNTDGSAFSNPQSFQIDWVGTSPTAKMTASIYLDGTQTLAPNSTINMPQSQYAGLGSYSLTAATTPLTITGVTASNKIYDGATTATLSGGTLVGVAGGDDVTLVAGTGTFANKTVGTGKTVTTTGYTLGGADAAKYSLSTQPGGITANITAVELTATGVTASNKVYDGTTTATLNGGSLTGVLGGDVVTLADGSGTFATKAIGAGIDVTATGYSLSGTDAANYTLIAQPSGITANITSATLTVTGVTASNKTYDGTTAATLIGGVLSGKASNDVVTLTAGTGEFTTKSVGSGKAVTATGYSISGADAGNYTLSQPSDVTGNVTAAILTITGVAVSNKEYDGTTTAMLSGGTLVGIAGGDIVTLVAGSAAFADKNVGAGKTITASGYSLSGANAANYTVSQPTDLTANITVASLSITEPNITLSKVYDGGTTATVIAGTLSGILPADAANVTLNATAAYDNATVGSGKTITVTYSLSGSAAGNYTAPSNSTVATGVITELVGIQLAVSAPTITLSKSYDGTSSAVVTAGTLSGVLAADAANVTLRATATYDNASVGVGKTITITYSLSGSAAGNYIAPSNSSVSTGVILAATLTVSAPFITLSKPYDATTLASVTAGALSGVLPTDTSNVTISATATYDNASVGVGKTITVTYSLSGSAADNYLAPSNSIFATGVITSVVVGQLTISAPTITLKKVYDGTKTATVIAGSLTGVSLNDLNNVILTASASYDDASAGTGKAITVKYSLSGSAAHNYTIIAEQTFSGGEIERIQLGVTNIELIESKVLNGSTNVDILSIGDLIGVLAIDSISVSISANANYDNANVGIGKTINIAYSLKGLAAGNYISPVNTVLSTGVITARPLTVSTPNIVLNKAYDGTSKASISAGVLSGVLNSDVAKVTIVATAEYENETVGTAKTITVSYSLSGLAAGNYIAPASTVVTTGIITALPLTVSEPSISFNKLYDGTNYAAVTPGTLSGVILADSLNLVLAASATYDDASAGSGKAITVKYNLSGSAAQNYVSLPDKTYPCGKIERKQLSLTDISVVTNKTMDGNAIAKVSTLGNLQGVLAVDENSVGVKPSANYDNATEGTNKTITISYTLLGLAKDNYLAPKDSVISNAVISEKIILNPIVSFTVKNEGSDIVLYYILISGTPTQYKLTFDSDALAAGVHNIDYTDLLSMSSNGTITLDIPNDMLYGTYHGTLQMRDELGSESSLYAFQFTVNVSSKFIVQLYNDVLTIDNSSECFIAYQWYKDGIEIVGAIKQFYNDKNGLNGSYSVKITTTDGVVRNTNPFVINSLTSKNINVYPNPIRINETFSVDAVGFDNQELVGATISVYSTLGTCVYLSTNVEKHNLLKLPLVASSYFGHIITKDGADYDFQVIVKQ